MMARNIPDDHWLRCFHKQAKLMQSLQCSMNIDTIPATQWATENQKHQLAQIEATVHSLRTPPAIVYGLQTIASLGQGMQTVVSLGQSIQTAASSLGQGMQIAASLGQGMETIASLGKGMRTVASLGQDIQVAARVFGSLPTQIFENLRQVQETWLQIERFTNEFVHLQQHLGINLTRLLQEQAAYYQIWIEKERDKFTEAFGLCSDYMFYGALRVVKNTDDARDVVQDSYVKALQKVQTSSLEDMHAWNVRAWLYTIARNTAVDFYRSQRHFVSYELNQIEQRPGHRFEQPEANLLRQELYQEVREAFRALPEIQHNIIFMRFFGVEVKWESIAAYLNCPTSTVRTYYTRGLRTLREHLSHHELSAADLAEIMDAFAPGSPHIDSSRLQSTVQQEE